MTRTAAVTLLTLCAAAPPASALSLEELNGPALPAAGSTSPGVTPWDTLGKTTVLWNDDDTVTTLVPPDVEALHGREVKLAGFMVPIEAELPMRQFLLTRIPQMDWRSASPRRQFRWRHQALALDQVAEA